MGPDTTCVIQVSNISPNVTHEHLRNLFSHVGTIREFAVYPNDPNKTEGRICFVKFLAPMNVLVAQHLNNTVFNEFALKIKPVDSGEIPDEILGCKLAVEESIKNTGIITQVSTHNGNQVLVSVDPRLVELGLPAYPPVLATLEPAKVEEIRRTIQVTNISETTTLEDLVTFFNQYGEVKFIRMTCPENDVIKTALVEFTEQASIVTALQNNGAVLNGSLMNIAHSTIAILKPKILERKPESQPSRSRRRSRSGSRRRSRSPYRSRTRRSRSKDRRRRSRTPERGYRRRSRSRSLSRDRRGRRDDRSRDRRRSKDRSDRRVSVERSRDRDRSRRDRSVDRNKDRSDRRRRDRSRSRDRDKDRRGRSRSNDRTKDRKRDEPRQKSRNRSRSRSKSHSVSRSSTHTATSMPHASSVLPPVPEDSSFVADSGSIRADNVIPAGQGLIGAGSSEGDCSPSSMGSN